MGVDVCPTVLWAPSTPIPGEHGKPPHMPLDTNSMVGADIYHTRRRRWNLPHASDINSVVGAYNHHCTQWREQQDLIAYVNSPSLTCKAIPFIYKRGCTLSIGQIHSDRSSSLLHNSRTTRFKPRAHARTLSSYRGSRHSRPFRPEFDRTSYTPIFLLLVCNPTANFEHLGSGIKSPVDSN